MVYPVPARPSRPELRERFDVPSDAKRIPVGTQSLARPTAQAKASHSLQTPHVVLAVCLNLSTPHAGVGDVEEAFFKPSTRHHERAMLKIMSSEPQ